MEKLGERESVLLGLCPQTSSLSSSKSPHSHGDMDFSDVFGGPPRRFSMQETRMKSSFSERTESDEENASLADSRWTRFDEKPVFGAESSSNRKQLSGDDFYDDIFKGGDDSKSYHSPRGTSSDVFGSNPGSRVLSPARPLPSSSEPFSPSSVAQFSLPAKLTKTVDFRALGLANRTLSKSKDNSTSPLSRFSSQAKELLDETRNDSSTNSCETSLSREVSYKSIESSSTGESDGREKRNVLQKDSESIEPPRNSSQFHFSIYKWAGNGVPMLMPLIASHKLRSKEKRKMERRSSFSGRTEKESLHKEMETLEEYIISVDHESGPLKVNIEELEESPKVIETKANDKIIEQNMLPPESERIHTAERASPHDPSTQRREKSHSKYVVDSKERVDKQTLRDEKPLLKPDAKTLHDLLSNGGDNEGIPLEGDGIAVNKANLANKNAEIRSKKNNSKGNGSRSEVNDISSQRSTRNDGSVSVKARAEGKIREFVKIFDQETPGKPKMTSDSQSHSSRWKGFDIKGKEHKTRNVAKAEENVHLPNKNMMPDVSFKDVDNFSTDKVTEDLHPKEKTGGLFTDEQNDSFFSDPIPEPVEVKLENEDERLQAHFQVEELSTVLETDSRSTEDTVDEKALDAKIHQWSYGRKGNIRSLLSTLQLVLWEGSGWKPVALVDIIEVSAVKRAYQKALLRLHPDKLQQKGAAFYQKYTAEKVFDILQEAWDHFNSLGAM